MTLVRVIEIGVDVHIIQNGSLTKGTILNITTIGKKQFAEVGTSWRPRKIPSDAGLRPSHDSDEWYGKCLIELDSLDLCAHPIHTWKED